MYICDTLLFEKQILTKELRVQFTQQHLRAVPR